MAKAMPDTALAALLSFEDEKDDRVLAEGALPTLNERVELFLRAKYGEGRIFAASERAAARARILGAMENNSAGELNAQMRTDLGDWNAEVRVRTDGQRQSPSGIIARLFGLLGPLPVASYRVSPTMLAAASLAILLLVCAGWSVAWLYSARTAESAVARWREVETRAGRIYQCDSQSTGGFPFHIVMQCTGATVRVAWDQSTIITDAKQIRAVASVLHPNVLSVEVTGPIWVWEHNEPAFLANWTQARVTIDNMPSSLDRLSVSIDGGQFYRMTQAGKELLLTSERLEAALQLNAGSDKAGPKFDITAHLAGGFLPSGPLPSRPFQADATAIVTDIPGDGPKDFSARLREWQANVGRVVIRSARIQQDDAVAVAQGDVGLNYAGRVEATLSAAVTGPYAQFVESLVRDAAKHNWVAVASDRLGTVAPTNIPVRFVDGAMYIEGVLIGNLPALYEFPGPNTYTSRPAPREGASLLPR